MKHPWQTTLMLIFLFICAQIIGLALINMDWPHGTTAIGERPDLSGYQSFLYLFFGVAIGTALLLLLAKFKRVGIWKVWFALAVFLALSVAFGVLMPVWVALILAAILAILKVFRPDPIVHNITEVFLYAGIAVLLVPIFDIFWMIVVLLVISVYDIIAVLKTKHMVTLAEFQKGSKVFAGLMLSKGKTGEKLIHLPKPPTPIKSTKTSSHAILGGGDVAFPLLFSGVVMEWLLEGGAMMSWFPYHIEPISRIAAFSLSLIISLFCAVALLMLFYYAKKERYYPAMPAVTIGCLVGFLVMFIFL